VIFPPPFRFIDVPYAIKNGQRPYSIIDVAIYFENQIGNTKTIIIFFDSTEEEDVIIFTYTIREEGTRISVGSRFEGSHASEPIPYPSSSNPLDECNILLSKDLRA